MSSTKQSATKAGRSKAAKARKLATSVSFRVALIGTTWQGFVGTYSYTFNHAPSGEEVVARAGDFQSIHDYETVSVTLIQYTDGERRIVKVVRPWQLPDSVELYCDANGY